jgi:uncharacterized membrane protein
MSATTITSISDDELRLQETEGVKRVAAISDGVFAIAMTLLVLDLHLPESDTIRSSADLRSALTLWSDYGAYALSFVVIALYWENHWRAFKRVLRIDRLALWLNMLLLLGIGFVPFPTSVLSDYGEYGSSTAFYAGTLGAIAFVWAVFWAHAVRSGMLAPNDKRGEEDWAYEAFYPSLVFLASAVIALWYPSAAKYVWFLMFLDPWLPGFVRRTWLIRN